MLQFFIADLHLSNENPEQVQLFLHFLQEQASGASHLYILGDLFEIWVGDDNDQPPIPEVIEGLRRLTQGGTRLGVMHGNRDFLLGERFCRATGAELLDDPTRLELDGVPTLLMHGDLLCTDDEAYQAFRRQVRDPAFQSQFLSLPLAARLEKAREYRAMSGEANSLKADGIMDVNTQTVTDTMRRYDVQQLIHGHTHRPAEHDLQLDGRSVTRLVLGDWQADGADILRLDAEGLRRQRVAP
jgi:UDP-2,3-diacylglucosamine hydrolase